MIGCVNRCLRLIRTNENNPDGFLKEFIGLARANGLDGEEIVAQIIMIAPAGSVPTTDQIGNIVGVTTVR